MDCGSNNFFCGDSSNFWSCASGDWISWKYMKPKWSKSEALIVDLLRDREFHCPTTELFGQIKDDRARLTSIRRKLQTVGFTIESKKCNLHPHKSQILMRRIIKCDSIPFGGEDLPVQSWPKPEIPKSVISPVIPFQHSDA